MAEYRVLNQMELIKCGKDLGLAGEELQAYVKDTEAKQEKAKLEAEAKEQKAKQEAEAKELKAEKAKQEAEAKAQTARLEAERKDKETRERER